MENMTIPKTTEEPLLAKKRESSEPLSKEAEKIALTEEEEDLAKALSTLAEEIKEELTPSEEAKLGQILAKAKRKGLSLDGANVLLLQRDALLNGVFRRQAKDRETAQLQIIVGLQKEAAIYAAEKKKQQELDAAKELAIRTYGLQRVGSVFFEDALKDLTIELVAQIEPKIHLGYHEGKAFSYHLGGYSGERGWGLTLLAYGLSAEHINLKKDFGERLYTLSWSYDKGTGTLIPKDAYAGFCQPLSRDYTSRLYPVLEPFLHKKAIEPVAAPAPPKL